MKAENRLTKVIALLVVARINFPAKTEIVFPIIGDVTEHQIVKTGRTKSRMIARNTAVSKKKNLNATARESKSTFCEFFKLFKKLTNILLVVLTNCIAR